MKTFPVALAILCGVCVLWSRDARCIEAPEQEQPLASTTGLPEHAVLRIVSKPADGKAVCAMVCFSPDGRTLAISQNAVIWLWDVVEQKATRSLRGHTEYVSSLAFSKDGTTLVSASLDATVRVWNPADGKERMKLECGNFNGNDLCTPVMAIAPDSKTLAYSKADKSIHVINLGDGKEIFSATGHQKDELSVASLAFSPEGKTLSSATERLMLWNAGDGERLHTFDDYFFPVAYSSDGKAAVCSGSENKGTDKASRNLKVWETETRKELHTLTGFKGLIYSVAFSPNDKLIAAACVDKKVHLWQRKSGDHLLTLEGHLEQVVSVSFSPDGKMLASSDYGERAEQRGTVLLWKLPKKD
jgi:uncharacterized protein with WD repeat